ncbi:MAG: phytanoyl-CoA dioxygenase family protein [Saprospiraceae bacterium]
MAYVLTSAQKEQYLKEGYLHLPSVYSENDIERARELIEDYIKSGGWDSAPHADEGVTTDIYERIPELTDIVFNEHYLSAMRQLFGEDAVVLAEPAIHKGRYYYWHKDSTFIDELGEDYHWKPDFAAAMTVMYLQENHPEYGGGITVVPGTHRDPDFYHTIPKMNLVERAILKGKKILKASHFDMLDQHPELYPIASGKGDLLVLDMRLDHKGTPALKPVPYEKYGIMNIACTGTETAERLRATLRRRSSGYYSNYLKNQPETTPKLQEKEDAFGVTIRL